jgi:hypothetical protein
VTPAEPGTESSAGREAPSAAAPAASAGPQVATQTAGVMPEVGVMGHAVLHPAGVLRGWAFDPVQPQQRLTVEVVDGNRVLARGLADRLRKDLAEAGIGDGHHAFELELPGGIEDGTPHTLRVRIAESGAWLPGAPIKTTGAPSQGAAKPNPPAPAPIEKAPPVAATQPAAPAPSAKPSAKGIHGHVAKLTSRLVRGWVYDPAQPQRRLTVELIEGDRVWRRTTADCFRPDLQQEGIGDGRHEFAFELPPELDDGVQHTLTIRVVEAPDLRLPGHAMTYTAPHASAASHPQAPAAPRPGKTVRPIRGSLDVVEDQEVHGWACDPRQPEHRLTVEIVEGERIVGRGCADLLRDDLRDAGIGDGRCHFRIRLSDELCDGRPHKLTARIPEAAGQVLEGDLEFQAAPLPSPEFDILPWADTVRWAQQVSGGWPDRRQADAFVADIQAANLLLETGEPKAAIGAFEQLAGKYPPNAVVQCKLGEAHLIAGDATAAAHAFQAAVQVDPLSGCSFLGLGNALRLGKDWQAAETAYRQGLEVAPQSAPLQQRCKDIAGRATYLQAEALLDKGDRQAALDLLMPLLLAHPDDPDIGNLVSRVLSGNKPGHGSDATPTSPGVTAARRAIDLLDAVVSHVSARGGTRP